MVKDRKLFTACFTITLIFVFVAIGVLVLLPQSEVTSGLRVVFLTAISVTTTGLIGALVVAGWIGFNAGRASNAKVAILKRDGDVLVVTAGQNEQVHIRERNKDASWRPAHLDPRLYANGKPGVPSLQELATYLAFHAGQDAPAHPLMEQQYQQLAAPVAILPDHIDLMEIAPGGRFSLKNIILGVRIDEQGQQRTVSAPLHRMVHLGSAGATDSGKSNFGRVIALQAALAIEDVELVFIDLKQTTYKLFRDVPRLRYPVVGNESDFMAVLSGIDDEMKRRKSLYAPHKTIETLPDYNRIVTESLPVIMVFMDEVSNLFMDKSFREVALKIIRQGRAFGIYFVNLGQTWSHKDMDTGFRAQHRTTGHFGTNDANSSRMMLGTPDAATITIPGRAYFALPFGMSRDVVEIQTPWLDPETALRMLPESHSIPIMPVVEGQAVNLDERENRIAEMVLNGATNNEIAQQVFKTANLKGSNYYTVKRIRDELTTTTY